MKAKSKRQLISQLAQVKIKTARYKKLWDKSFDLEIKLECELEKLRDQDKEMKKAAVEFKGTKNLTHKITLLLRQVLKNPRASVYSDKRKDHRRLKLASGRLSDKQLTEFRKLLKKHKIDAQVENKVLAKPYPYNMSKNSAPYKKTIITYKS